MHDTSPEMEEKMREILAGKSPGERLRMACDMFACARALMRAGIKSEDPTLSEAQIRGRMFVRTYGDLFTREEIDRIAAHNPCMQVDWDSDVAVTKGL